jgi:uncharacterized protein (DUF486 family)
MNLAPQNTALLTVCMLFVSNVFMTFAWYAHLKHKGAPLLLVIVASWGVAFFEYLVMVPANRWGSAIFTTTQLKVIQEVVTLTVFSGFVVFYMGEKLRWNHFAAFACIIAAVLFTFMPKQP